MSVSYVGMLAMDDAATKCLGVRLFFSMGSIMKRLILSSIIALLSLSNAPADAASCQDSIGRVQAQVDAAIDRQADNGPSKPESLDALRSHQPTPQSIATAEGGASAALTRALDALGRARAADAAGDSRRCRAEVSTAQRLLAPF
jgi:hypothetical protein